MREFVSYPFYWDEAPLDISFAFGAKSPAGQHGFLTVKGDQLVFADGTPGRFWGTNFNSGACFPDFDYSEKTARRLASFGVNIVRFHQLDSEWATPNIFQFKKGARQKSSRSLDPQSMERLDYLVYCLKKEGIYCYLDLMTYRKFKSGDGVENALALGDSAKPYSIFSRRLIDLQKEFINNIWNHVNPYTGLAYKDDPVFVLCEITNECDMFNKRFKFDVEPYHTELVDLMEKWLERENLTYPARAASFLEDDEIMIRFKMAVQESYYREMIQLMRDIGVKIPITGTNWGINVANALTQKVTDFDDSHQYFYGWNWGEFEKGNDPRPLVSQDSSFFSHLALNCSPDRPFFVSEWDVPWPNEYRADSSLLMAAIGALQGWSGYTIHTYMYATRRDQQVIGKEINASTISNVPYREGIFATWNDPAKFGLFYHAALILRRGDVARAQKNLAIDAQNLLDTSGGIPALALTPEQHKVGLVFDGQKHAADELVSSSTQVVAKAAGEVRADTGEISRNWARGIGRIDTAATQCVYGFLGQAGRQKTRDLEVTVDNEYAVIALSSLTEAKISSSDNLLLTTVGRAENTGFMLNDDKTKVLDTGRPPIQVEVIKAKISLQTDQANLTVWSIGPEGFFTGRIPSEYQDGKLSFQLGETCRSIYYLILAE